MKSRREVEDEKALSVLDQLLQQRSPTFKEAFEKMSQRAHKPSKIIMSKALARELGIDVEALEREYAERVARGEVQDDE
jgi:hypothetical protein